MPTALESPKRRRIDWLTPILALACAGLIVFATNTYVFESVFVPSSSMRPSFIPGDSLILRFAGYRQVHRYDVVVVEGTAFGHRILKRVIGLPGDCVQLQDSWKVVLNGRPLTYQQLDEDGTVLREEGHTIQLRRNPKFSFDTLYGREPLCLKQDEYYVLGDNRLASDDSRTIGPVHRANIQGKIDLIWLSYDHDLHKTRWNRLLTRVP